LAKPAIVAEPEGLQCHFETSLVTKAFRANPEQLSNVVDRA
jgi:hypothetical protein